MDRLGFVLMMLGMMAADSERLIVPLVMIAAGAVLMWKGGAFDE